MPPRRFFPHRPLSVLTALVALSGALSYLLRAPAARADFAEPPPSPYRPDDPTRVEPPPSSEPDDGESWQPADSKASTLRFHVGPAVLLEPASPGLFTALDIGQRAVGARVSASWLRAETQRGLAAYTAELWVDFRRRSELHPILGAGASYLRGGALDDARGSGAGAGVLRGALEYELPIIDADARLSLNLLALVPAIGTERARPWTMATVLIGAGF